jgi:hypothetical protein
MHSELKEEIRRRQEEDAERAKNTVDGGSHFIE